MANVSHFKYQGVEGVVVLRGIPFIRRIDRQVVVFLKK